MAAVTMMGAGSLAAQETGTPVFMAPYRAFERHEIGLMLSDPEGASIGLEGQYRFGSGVHDLGIRAGYIDYDGDEKLSIGGSWRGRVISHSEQFPLDGAITVGLGAQLGDGPDPFFVPVGLSLGRRIDLENSKTSFVPYVQPVIIPTFWSGEGAPDGGIDFALGLGVDIRFGANFDLRVSGGIGDLEGVAIGVVWVR
ncbi:MAG TPA: hypothetical protein VFX50_06290 [Gemmatimonadales bacterium]|nr:hypothetical protein [Gemmatimonadales bacterium]